MPLKSATLALALVLAVTAGSGLGSSWRLADVAITNVETPNLVAKGQASSYTMAVRNNGPTRAQSVTATETLPTGVTLNSYQTTQGTCAVSQSNGTYVLRCSLGTVSTGARPTITISATPTVAGQVTATASVAATSPSDPTLGNNTALATATVADSSSTDTTPPVVTVPPDQRVEAQGASGATVSYPAASAVDAVDGSVPVVCSPSSGSVFPLGATQVGCTAGDSSGNTGFASFTVSVVDTTAPQLTVPTPITVSADSSSGAARSNPTIAAFLGAATARDLVDPAPAISTNAPDLFPVGTTQVVFTATDASGNRTSASSTVTVQGTSSGGGSGGSVLWRGDAESGDFSQWTGGTSNCEVQAARVPGSCYPVKTTSSAYGTGDGDIQVVSSPTHGAGSTRAFKHTIYTTLNGSDNSIRADLYATQAEMGAPLLGTEQYWHFAFLLPSLNGLPQQWADYNDHNTIADFHWDEHSSKGNAITQTFGVRPPQYGNSIYWESQSDAYPPYSIRSSVNLAPVAYDQWYDVIVYQKWGTTDSTSATKVWISYPGSGGYVLKVDVNHANLSSGGSNYFKEALYSGAGYNQTVRTMTNSIVFDGACRGTSFAAASGC